MSDELDINLYVHARFREAFGDPQLIAGKDEQWTLAPGQDVPTISVVLNGSREGATLWVFDPHSPGDTAFNTLITRKEDVDGLIERVRAQFRRAVADARKPTRREPPQRRGRSENAGGRRLQP